MQVSDQTVFARILLEILQLHPEGLGEYALLQRLRSDARVAFDHERLDDPHDLFRTHFLLFHHLYRLGDQLRDNQRGDLEIHALNIRWHPAGGSTAQALAQPDPLAQLLSRPRQPGRHYARGRGPAIGPLLGTVRSLRPPPALPCSTTPTAVVTSPDCRQSTQPWRFSIHANHPQVPG